MTTDVIQPFDFNPNSADVKTGSFTIPAGKYAIVTAMVQNGGTFTIDATVALTSKAAGAGQTITAVAQDITTVASFTVPANSIFEGVAATDSGETIQVDGFVIVGASEGNARIVAGPGAVIDATAGTAQLVGYTVQIAAPPHPTPSTSSTGTFFGLPTGTVLDVTGDGRYTVSLFNIIS